MGLEDFSTPLSSGFTYHKRTAEDDLPKEVQEMMQAKFREWDLARARAAAEARTAVIG